MRPVKFTQGVYAIVHRASGARYVGSSKVIEVRVYTHRAILNGANQFGCPPKLVALWKRDGEKSFDFVILEEVRDAKLLLAREEHHLLMSEKPLNKGRVYPRLRDLGEDGLTDAQRNMLEAIKEISAEKGYSPSIQEIADRVGYRSVNAVHQMLALIEKAGFIRIDKNISRGIAIL